MVPSLNSRVFGFLPAEDAKEARAVETWTLKGSGGLTVEAITYGGIVTRLLAPDRDGKLDDVVLGFNNLDAYVADHPYFGAITGRVAGRIPGAAFSLDGTTYKLALNNSPNHIHGGIQGLDKRLWTATPVNRADGAPSLQLAYFSPDGEEGYPGNLRITVSYTVAHDNVFLIETEATTDRATPLSLTNHSYFNLSGEGSGSVAEHQVQVFANSFVPTDEDLALLGRFEPVADGANDLRQPQRLGDVIPKFAHFHGAMYLVRSDAAEGTGPKMVKAARVVDPSSGRVLTTSTTETYLQFYTGSHLEGPIIGKSGRPYERYAGLCLECEGYPNPGKAPDPYGIIVRPGQTQRHITAYAFSTDAAEAAAN